MLMVSTSQSPQNVAAELLTDVSQPTLRDLKVEFDGLQIAAVYPTKLPNLAEGKQQMILARYLPIADDTNPAMVTISGTRNGQPVSWKTPLKFDQAEAGNSFIPRLWARKHLDYLLAQGSAPSIQDQVIELSERFHIITPYTSLLATAGARPILIYCKIKCRPLVTGESAFSINSYSTLQHWGNLHLGTLTVEVVRSSLTTSQAHLEQAKNPTHSGWGGT